MAIKNFRPYPAVTVKLNSFGHLELWRGKFVDDELATREADVYIQLDTDVQSVLESLPANQRGEVDDGWTTVTYFITDEYFGN